MKRWNIWGRSLCFRKHVRKVTEKTKRTVKALQALMPNIDGPSEAKRRILFSAVQSIVIYAAPIWWRAANVGTYKRMIASVEKQATLRICSAYRTVSNEALAVIAGVIPLHLIIKERRELYVAEDEEERSQKREVTMVAWQEEWNGAGKGRWTHQLIPDIKTWTGRKHGKVNYHLTQVLTGHGCFSKNLCKIKKKENPGCFYCDEDDDACHTMFRCERWERYRQQIGVEIGTDLTSRNMVQLMLQKDTWWTKINDLIVNIMTKKEAEERERQNRIGAQRGG